MTHHSMKSPCAYIFSSFVDDSCVLCNFSDGLFGKFEIHPFCFKKGLVLFNK